MQKALKLGTELRCCLMCRRLLPSTDKRQKYCSRACYLEMRKPQYQNCNFCQKEFHRSPSQIIGGFCSQECFGRSKTLPENHCIDCGCVVLRKNVKCRCRKCYTASRVKLSPAPCVHCGDLVQRSPSQLAQTSRKHGVFCSHSCYGAHVKGEKSHSYINGNANAKYPLQFHKIRNSIIQRDGSACFLCANSAKKLDVHHIDGQVMNNSWLNLITLCRGCHNRVHGKLGGNGWSAQMLSAALVEKYPISDQLTI